ncbi:MAG: glycosyltransferase [Aquiluna sp.]|nr:glycosyltransferase [Aquiluna sp.]
MKDPIRVIIACDTFAPSINGAARFAERLAGGLVRNGHDVHVIAPSNENWFGSRQETHDGASITVHRLKSHRMPNHKSLRWPTPLGMRREIRKVILEVRPEALHIQSHLMVGRFALLASRGINLRKIATNHVMPENLMRYSLLPRWLYPMAMRILWADAGRVLKKMDAITTPTRRAADLLERAAGLQGVLAISCGIDASKFANQTPTQNSRPVALFLGRLDDEKRINVLLDAMSKLDKFPALELRLVGDGGERDRLTAQAKSLGLGERVHFLGHIGDSELPKAYEDCTVFVMPSIAELQSIATMEAMASGRPIIAADAMALPHLVHDGDNGYLFPPDDADALRDRLERILSADEAELARLSENSIHLIQSHDIAKTITIFENLYQGIGEEAPTTLDNEPSYMLPIGRLSASLRRRVEEFRHDALNLRRRAEDASEYARGRFSGAAGEARERLLEVRGEVREQLSEFRTELTEAAKKLRKKKGD